MAKTELIDERVSVNQCKQAIDALHAHESKKAKELQESELLPGKEPNIWLNVTVKKIPSGHKFKPAKISIAHPLIDPRTTSICLITKDPQREYKDLLESHNIKFISRVVGIEKLKGKFKPYEARRILLKENGLFLADERIVPLLPKLLGVKWFEAKKSVKFATLSHTPKQILANLKLALPEISKHIMGGWNNIQALHIKTNSSVSLPIWSCTLDEADSGRWAPGLPTTAGLSGLDGTESSESETDTETKEVVVEKVVEKVSGKGKKRVQEEEVQKPKKKAKGVTGHAVKDPAALTGQSSTVTSTPSSTPKTDAPVESSTKSKKRKSELPPVVESPSAPLTKKALKKSVEPATPQVEKALPKKQASTPKVASNPVPSAPSPAEDKTRKNKNKTKPTSDAPIVPSLTKDELKQKRSVAPGEKKKSKVNATGGKSAKDRIIGKKAAQ
ncbi:hypothetical protein C0991_001799 [Blastosporella zonata]|nr:hypothetical protein C0991_001799 [Blastosporella zonata]